MKSVAAGFSLLLSLAAGLSCRKQESPLIAIVPKAKAELYWQSVHAGAAAAAEEVGVNLVWSAPSSEVDFTRQINIVDEFINQRVAGIVLAPANADLLVPVVERAAQEKIPVAIFDSGIESEKYLTYVSTDNYQAGVLAARRLGGRLASGKVAIIGTTPGSLSTAERERGFRETVATRFPGLQVVDYQYGMSDPVKSRAAAQDILMAHPDLAGLFCTNESATTGAVLAARSMAAAGKLKIVGFDCTPMLIEELKSGNIDSLILQDPFRMGYLSVKAVADKLRGRTPEKRIETGAAVVTAANLADPALRELVNPPIARYLKQPVP